MDSSFDDTALTVLVAGRDYPRTYHEHIEMFPDDAAFSHLQPSLGA